LTDGRTVEVAAAVAVGAPESLGVLFPGGTHAARSGARAAKRTRREGMADRAFTAAF
jgi:hypothetical protein